MSLSRIPLQQIFRTRTASLSTTSSNESTEGVLTSTGTTPDSTPYRPATRRPILTMAAPQGRGTRTPQMLEYERQAEERAREADAMAEERTLMLETQQKMETESARIAQEEYEMKQYYEAEALKHAEEMRLHQEEVRRHQERIREHERRILDHEASSEAFAKVIAMPAKQGAMRQVSFLGVGKAGGGSTRAVNGNGAPPASFPIGN